MFLNLLYESHVSLYLSIQSLIGTPFIGGKYNQVFHPWSVWGPVFIFPMSQQQSFGHNKGTDNPFKPIFNPTITWLANSMYQVCNLRKYYSLIFFSSCLCAQVIKTLRNTQILKQACFLLLQRAELELRSGNCNIRETTSKSCQIMEQSTPGRTYLSKSWTAIC